ncbi:MAG: MerR family transcriptional regulator [Gemmatimonadales bacterium]|nr:MerR family transcriptional regulator [Gemmatimonadales bacterium]
MARLTGLAAARLRAWERRYEVVRPVRQPNGYRAYTAEQVALLRAFARLIESGERIGDLAARPLEEVLERAEQRDIAETPHGALLDAVVTYDRDRLEALVGQEVRERGLAGFARDVVMPLAIEVGDLWALGKIPIAAEHLASEVVLHALKGGLRARTDGPVCVAALLPHERHEWGFLCCLADVQDLGWQIHYLGPDLPPDDVVEAAWKRGARAVAISASDPANVEPLLPTLAQMPSRLPARTVAVAGGGGIAPFERFLTSHGFRIGLDAFASGVGPDVLRDAVG